jgi:putative ABC transport system permease protein
MAFEQKRGAASLPLRSALAGTIVGLAALVVAVMFGTTLNRLVTDPHQYGWQWDAIVDSGFGVFPYKTLGTSLLNDRRVRGLTAGNYGEAVIAGRDVPAVGLDEKKGGLYPYLLEGKPAATPTEIVLGTTVMRRIHAHIGSTIPVTIFGKERQMVVVGRSVFPSMGRGSFAPVSLGDGVAVVASSLPQLTESGNPATGDDIYNFVIVRANSVADRKALLADLKEHFLVGPCILTNDCNLTLSARPLELGVLATEVRSAPLVLAGLLALFAIATMAHAILTSVRMRARDLAVLKTLGFVKRQIRATVAWQTSALAFTALLLGIPLGVMAARATWSMFAEGLGVPPSSVVPMMALVIGAPLMLIIANLIGMVPARVAARTEAAVVLRAE